MAYDPMMSAAPPPYAAAYAPAYVPGYAPSVSPTAPAPAYQGLLDQLHLASQAPSLPTVPPTMVPMALPPSGIQPSFTIPVLSGLFDQLKSLLNQWLTPSPPPSPPAPTTPSTPPSGRPPTKTTFVISSFNVLGSSHTKGPGSDRPGMAPGVQRIRTAAELLERHDVDVVGFQEFQGDQFDAFKKVAGDKFAVYPGFKLDKGAVVNSIAWRKETWDLVKGDFIDIPYFGGKNVKMPVVRLRNKQTGQEAYFANFHNPASTRKQGDHEKWRDVATQKEIDLVNRLRQQTGLPVFITGDMNERDEYYDKMTAHTDMTSADTGRNGKPPKSMAIDWIFGTESMVTFSDYTRDRSALVKKTSDHPMIVSKATIKPTGSR